MNFDDDIIDDFESSISNFISTEEDTNASCFMHDYELIYIKNNKLNNFLTEYCKFSEKEPINVSEKLTDFSKLYFLCKYPKEFTEITNEFIVTICYCVQKLINENFDEVDKITDNSYLCFFLQDNTGYFKLWFPFFEIGIDSYFSKYRDKLIKKLSRYFEDEKIDLEELVIESKDEFRPLYRSDGFEIKYIITKLESASESLEENLFDLNDIGEIFYPSFIKKKENILLYLPLLFSDHCSIETIQDEEDPDKLVYIEEAEAQGKVFEELDDENEDDDDEDNRDDIQINKFDLAIQLLEMINYSRFKNEETWKAIGRAICWCCNGARKGLKLWMQVTEKARSNFTNFVENYRNTQTSCNTIRTLAGYAMTDSKIQYNAWHKKWVNAAVEKATTCNDLDIAKVLYTMYWLEFVYDDDEGCWYQFFKTKWIPIKRKAIELRKRLTSIITRIDELKKRLSIKLCRIDDGSEKKVIDTLLLNCIKLTTKLKNDKGRNGIISLASEFFYERGFISKLNKNPNLLGVDNGVIELTPERAIFRDCKPDDYISISTRVPLDVKLNWDSDCVDRCIKWFMMIFDDLATTKWFILFSSSLLRAYNNKKIFPSFTGKGNNAKSSVKRLYEETLGPDYCWTFPISLLVTGIRGVSSGANPEIAGSENARIAFAQEPKRADKINSSTVKELTGDDTIYNRQLYREGRIMKIMFKIVYLSNKPLQLEEYDQAMKNRCIFIDFGSTWSKDAPEDIEEQKRTRTYKDNPLFSEELPKLARGFLWIMYISFSDFCKEGLVLPPSVRQFTDNYWKENDSLVNFVEECIERTDEKGEGIRVKFLYDIYISWYKEANGTQIPTMEWFKSEISCKIGVVNRNRWYNYSLTDKAIEIAALLNILN